MANLDFMVVFKQIGINISVLTRLVPKYSNEFNSQLQNLENLFYCKTLPSLFMVNYYGPQ